MFVEVGGSALVALRNVLVACGTHARVSWNAVRAARTLEHGAFRSVTDLLATIVEIGALDEQIASDHWQL